MTGDGRWVGLDVLARTGQNCPGSAEMFFPWRHPQPLVMVCSCGGEGSRGPGCGWELDLVLFLSFPGLARRGTDEFNIQKVTKQREGRREGGRQYGIKNTNLKLNFKALVFLYFMFQPFC